MKEARGGRDIGNGHDPDIFKAQQLIRIVIKVIKVVIDDEVHNNDNGDGNILMVKF